jgi:hypothetical protein
MIPDDISILSVAVLALSGRGYAMLQAGVNFAFWGFSEVRSLLGALAYLVPLRTYIPLTQEYAAFVPSLRGQLTPREGVQT